MIISQLILQDIINTDMLYENQPHPPINKVARDQSQIS